jgi:competence protein ComFC
VIKPFPSAKRWLNAALGFIYPEVCQLCQLARAGPSEGFVCPSCWRKLHFIKPPFCDRCGLPYDGAFTTEFECANCRDMELNFRTARAAVVLNPFVIDIIHRYKYLCALWFEPFLADILIRAAAPVLAREKCDLIVPVPLHPAKRREREFNQAERLGAWLSRATGIPMNKKLVQRVKSTQTQTLLDRPTRRENVQRAFAMRPGVRLEGERVVLLDDVFTTGATTGACAKVLASAGAGDVCVWTVARGL